MKSISGKWLSNASAQAFLKAAEDAGFEAYFVGGCVRNALLSLPVNDLDISTNARPEEVMALAKELGFKPVQNNSRFYEIHALRSDREGNPSLAGNVITDARATREQDLSVGVSMTMNQEGTVKWKRLTADAAKNKESVAIVLDNRVYSSPTVQNEIPNGRSSISGNFDIQEATDLSNILKAGKLPAKVIIAGENTVGPTLGAKAIRNGLLSLIVGFLLVVVFMCKIKN